MTKEKIKGLKLVNENVKYISLNEEHVPNEIHKKQRAWSYLQTITMLNDVGIGADGNLTAIKTIIYQLKEICYSETGYEITDTYATDEVGSSYKGWKQNPFEKAKKVKRK